MAEGLPSRNTIGTSLQTMSRNTPPKIPVITPIIEAMKRGMWASSAEATPAMENRPRPMASAITIRRSETIWRMARIRGEAPRASTKIRMAYSWWVTQNRGRWSSRMSRRVPPPKAVMNATVNTPTRSMRFLRASIKPENAPTRIARISMRVISDMRCDLLVGIATGYHGGAAVGDACRRGGLSLADCPRLWLSERCRNRGQAASASPHRSCAAGGLSLADCPRLLLGGRCRNRGQAASACPHVDFASDLKWGQARRASPRSILQHGLQQHHQGPMPPILLARHAKRDHFVALHLHQPAVQHGPQHGFAVGGAEAAAVDDAYAAHAAAAGAGDEGADQLAGGVAGQAVQVQLVLHGPVAFFQLADDVRADAGARIGDGRVVFHQAGHVELVGQGFAQHGGVVFLDGAGRARQMVAHGNSAHGVDKAVRFGNFLDALDGAGEHARIFPGFLFTGGPLGRLDGAHALLLLERLAQERQVGEILQARHRQSVLQRFQVALSVERGHAARARAGDGLAVDVVLHVAGRS